MGMVIALLAASAVLIALNRRKPLAERIETYASGMGETNIMMMCLILILAGAFTAVAKGSGAVDAAVAIAWAFIPAKLMLAGVFLVSCLISLAIGTSCGTIAAVTPIALGFSDSLGISPAILMGAVIGGAMFGDNLSMISDTTIAATRTQGVAMKDKFYANALIALPAALVAFALYAVQGAGAEAIASPRVGGREMALVLPYILVFVLALVGGNVMGLLFLGAILSTAIGVAFGAFDFSEALALLGGGTLEMGETLIVALLAGGLFRLVQASGGIHWLMDRIASFVRGPKTCELGVALLASAVNFCTANNTVAIVIVGPIARECAKKFGADPVRIASILDTASCVVQGIIPYGTQILIALGVAKGLDISVGPVEILKCLYYQPLLALAVAVGIVLGNRKSGVSA